MKGNGVHTSLSKVAGSLMDGEACDLCDVFIQVVGGEDVGIKGLFSKDGWQLDDFTDFSV